MIFSLSTVLSTGRWTMLIVPRLSVDVFLRGIYPTMHLFQVFLAQAVSVIADSTEYFWEFCKKAHCGYVANISYFTEV